MSDAFALRWAGSISFHMFTTIACVSIGSRALDEAKGNKHDLDESEPEPPKTTLRSDEIEGVFDCAYDTEDEDDLWYVLNLVWEIGYLSALVGRVGMGTHPRRFDWRL